MENPEGNGDTNAETSSASANATSEYEDWLTEDDVPELVGMPKHKDSLSFFDEVTHAVPFVGDKEPISALADEYEYGSPIILEKIKELSKQYVAIRRTRRDGNCFFRGFIFSYLEHVLETEDRKEVDRVKANVEDCRKTFHDLGYLNFFEVFFTVFLEQLENVLQGSKASISHEELTNMSRDQSVSESVVMFCRFVTSGEIRKRSKFFEPFIYGLANSTVDQFCKSSVETMGEESDHVQITALSDALGVPIRIVYLDQSPSIGSGISVNHHDFLPAAGNFEKADQSNSVTVDPFVTLLYRPGHYDILYPK